MKMMRSRMGFCEENGQDKKRPRFCPRAAKDYSDPFDLCNLQEGLDLEKFGSVAKDIEQLIARRRQFLEKRHLSAAEANQKPHPVILDSDSHSQSHSDDANEKSDNGPYDDDDDVGDVWKEMAFVMAYSKDTSADHYPSEEEDGIIKGNGDCDHIFILKEDIGTVCRVCGFILQSIETIIDFQFGKAKKSSRSVYRRAEERATSDPSNDGTRISSDGKTKELNGVEELLSAHPRHEKLMKPHQIEGFKFLVKNLVGDHPTGCILAHAPGSGKTFMIITFLRSYMSKCPEARPLVVLPKGILSTWKREFLRWQVGEDEDGDPTIPLLDFYSAKAESRCQQLDVLRRWSRERSVLFLGYKQFSSIVCSDDDHTAQTAECRRILLACPSILVRDEGHTPRNEDTDTLTSLGMVQTPRKVVLSGTLYQNSVREVFNIVNLVHPKFMNLPASRDLKRRILSRAIVSGNHSNFSDREFFEVVEKTMSKDDNFSRKVSVIKDLREMTSNVLHFYKGDFLDELPGLVDFTVLLKLSEKQRNEVEKLKKLHNQRFRVISECSAIYIHPKLKSKEGMLGVLEDSDDGAKTKFYLNLLNLCESCGEKLLVFSQFLLPLKFLERLTGKIKGYSVGKEMFMITGDSDSTARDGAVEAFNSSPNARVFFGSIRACGEGISLVGASRVVVLDVHLNPSVTRQAVGRAFRPGQTRKVYVYRLVAAGSPEEDDHRICFEKESVSKMWFEWSEHDGRHHFGMTAVDVETCGDMFLESPCFSQDIVSLYRR